MTENDWHGLYLLEKERAETSEEYVRELSPALEKANKRVEHLASTLRLANDNTDAYMKRAEEAERLADKRLLQRQAAKKRAQSAEARKVEAEKRAEAAEADRDWYRSVVAHNVDDARDAKKRAKAAIDEMHETERFAAAMRERSEAAEARVRDLEFQLEGATESLEEARGRVGELEAENERLAKRYRKLGAFYELRELLDDDLATFTAPDVRKFRVGQRVWCTAEREYGTVASLSGSVAWIDYPRDRAMSSLSNLRRVWDGSEEPDVPVGTVIRGADGFYLRKGWAGFWSLWHSGTAKWGSPLPWDDWDHGEDILRYVEHLPGDDG